MKKIIIFSIILVACVNNAHAMVQLSQDSVEQQHGQLIFASREAPREITLTPSEKAAERIAIRAHLDPGNVMLKPRTESLEQQVGQIHLQRPSRYERDPIYKAWDQGVTQPGYGRQYPSTFAVRGGQPFMSERFSNW